MTAIAKKLDAKMKQWRSSTAKKVEALVTDIIALADSELPANNSSKKNSDEFLTDKRVYHGRTPKDLAANHDLYLYGDE